MFSSAIGADASLVIKSPAPLQAVATDGAHIQLDAQHHRLRMAPNQKWLADMTYVPTDEGLLYVALMLDLYARKLVGWAMSETMPQELTRAALDVALG